ncbi:hypothetical protein MN608_04250 [Microdochium nivale]|nr:hypothetical protein MN608_04250 [Microdochium nivale]
MGLVVCVVGIMRIYYLSQVFVGGDILWNGTPIWICSILEVNLGIICACLTGIKPVIVKLFPGVFSSSQRSQENRHSYVQYGQHTERMTAGGPESFAFEQLSSIKLKHSQSQQQQQNHPGGEGNSSNAAFGKGSANDLGVHASGKMYVENPILKSNNVWVTITNHKGAEHHLPANAIGVSHEFTVNNEAPNGGSMTSRSANNEPSDADSEEWIFNGAENVESARTK